MGLWRRLKNLIVHRILGVADTPHRIALGVFLGFVVAWTPTLGFQIMIYVALASLFRANKVTGVPILFISNPVTAVPLYWFVWRTGAFVLGTGDGENVNSIMERLQRSEDQAADTNLFADIWTKEFWSDLGTTLGSMGAELWVGALLLGLLTGALCYPVTFFGVRAFRRARGR